MPPHPWYLIHQNRLVQIGLKTFVKIVNGLVELEDDLLLLLEELPPDGHQVALLLHHPQPRPGDINYDLELRCAMCIVLPYPSLLHLAQLVHIEVVEELLENSKLVNNHVARMLNTCQVDEVKVDNDYGHLTIFFSLSSK